MLVMSKLNININYVQFGEQTALPFYLFDKLYKLNTNIELMQNVTKYYDHSRIFYSCIRTKTLKFIITLFKIECELWSNPFIACARAFCSNEEVIDRPYGGIQPLTKLDMPMTCMLLVDQRPSIVDIKGLTLEQSNKDAFTHKLDAALNLVTSHANDNVTLVVATYNDDVKLPPSIRRQSSTIKTHSYNVTGTLWLHFVQTRLGHAHVTPSQTKIDILKSFIENKEANFRTHTRRTRQIILGVK